MKEAIYTLTTACIESGVLRLTYSLRRLFTRSGDWEAETPGGERLYLQVDLERGELHGLGAWLAAEGLGPNDQLRFVLEDERLSVAPLTKRVRQGERPRLKTRPSLPRLDPRPQAAPKEMPHYVALLTALGFEASYLGGPWLLSARMGRKAFALVAGDERVGVEALDEARRRQGVAAALLVGAAPPRPGIAVADVESLEALVELHRVFPLGPLELKRLLAKGRVGPAELEALRREVEALLGERAAFSTVLSGLAGFRPQQVFLLEDLLLELGGAVGGDVAARILEVLAGPPFFALVRLAPGEYQLRQPVDQVLDHLAAYAQRLKARLPVGG